MPRKSPDADTLEARARFRRDVGRRLRMAREVLGMAQGEFGRRAGLNANAYNMIELGERLPSIEVAIAICDAHRLTLEYVFRGDTGDLPHSVGAAIEALAAARSSTD